MNMAFELKATRLADIALQEASLNIWDTKYRLKTKSGEPVDRDIDGTYERVAKALAAVEEPAQARRVVRAVSVGAATRRDSGRPNHVERRRRVSQARDVDDQLHGVGHDSRLDARHPRQGARGRPHAEGRLRHRLRVLDAAAARRLRQRRRRLYVGPAVVHGYLRQDVLHGVVRRRSARRADGHVRRRPSRRDGLHSREARGRPAAPVQSVAADHRRVHAGREGRSAVAARVSADAARGRGREHRPRRHEASRLARVADEGRATSSTTAGSSPAASTGRCRRVACGTSSCRRRTTSPSPGSCSSIASTR